MGYSFPRRVREAVRGTSGSQPAWRDAAPAAFYDVVLVGGGGHGLATAFYLARQQWARQHGVRRVAVLQPGWVGGDAAGPDTSLIGSNFLLAGHERFHELSLQMWEGLQQDLGCNCGVSQRGVLNLVHSDAARDAAARRGNAMALHGAGAELLDREQMRQMCPWLDMTNERFPIRGGLLQRRGGTARHDAVVWGYARAADRLGVDIVQHCAATGFLTEQGRVVGVETTRGLVRAGRVGVAVAGHSGAVMAMAGMRLPIESHGVQAFVSEAVKPMINPVVTFGDGYFHLSQSERGGLVFGGDVEGYASYAQRGTLPAMEDVMQCCVSMVPAASRLRVLHSWGGVVDQSMDGSPIIDRTPVDGLFLNAGWGSNGFTATPASGWCFAHLLATGVTHPAAATMRLDRFETGAVLDERPSGRQANLP